MIALSSIKVSKSSMQQQLVAGDATYFNFTQDNNSAFNATGASASTGMQHPTVTNDLRVKLSNGSFFENFNNFNNLSLSDSSNLLNDYNKVRISYNIYTGTGIDGDTTVTGTKNINTNTISTKRSRPDGINFNVISLTSTTARLSTTPVAGDLTAGDEILLINLQGTSSNYSNVGNYETLKINSISGDTITFATAKTKYYGSGSSDDLNIGTTTSTQRVMIQRIPQYNNMTIDTGNTLTANAWDGTKGGILFFRVAGTLTLYGTITMSSKGYRGGSGGSSSYGYQGESYTGSYNVGQSSSANGGGGGAGSGPSDAYRGNGGGGASFGGTGTAGTCRSGSAISGATGNVYGTAQLTKIYMGSGGGSGSSNGTSTSGSGGIGGGAIGIFANIFVLQGSIVNDGGNAGAVTYNGGTVGGGGAGCGGTLLNKTIELTIGTCTVTGIGGTGTAGNGGGGTGGNGGVGRIAFYYKVLSGSISSNPTSYSLETTPVNTSTRIRSSKILDGHTVNTLQKLNYRLERKPSGTDVKIQFSQDQTNQYNASQELNQQSTLTTDTTTLLLSGLSSQSGNNFYYRIDMSSTGNDSPVLDQLEIDYDPDVYELTEQYWKSHVIDSIVGARVKTLYCEQELDQSDQINPKFQILASNTGLFTGEETTFPAGTGTYFQYGGTYTIDNSESLDIQGYVGYNFYRYQKVVLFLDAGSNLSDSPKIKTFSMNGLLKTIVKSEQIGDTTSILSNTITKNTSVKLAEKTVSVTSSQRLMIIGELELDNTGYDFSNGGTITNMWIAKDGTQLDAKLESRHLYEFQYQKVVIDVPTVGEVKYQIYGSETLNKCNSNVKKINLRIFSM